MKFRHPRRPSDAVLEFEHGDEIVEAVVRDISRFGMRIEGDFYLAGPDTIALLYHGRHHSAKIVWMRFGALGLCFDEPLDKDTYAAILGHRRGSGGRQVHGGKRRFVLS